MNFFGTKKIIIIFVVIGAVAVIAMLVVSFSNKKSSNQPVQNQDQNADVVVKANVDFAKLPSASFPTDIPIEANAKILYNYTATRNGREQATRVFETSKSLADNFKLYQQYFKDNGWTIDDTIDQADLKSILATRGKLSAQVDISNNPATKVKIIDITINQLGQ